MPITRTLEAGVALLTLDLGRGNAIDHPFIDALDAALDAALADGARAVVITGRGKVFCGGLDLVTIWEYDRAAMGRFVDAFDGLFRKVLAFPRPVVAAVNGHALAGGCILMMACDHRLAQPGTFQIGLNEVALGIPFPAAAFEVARRATPDAAASAVFLEGRRFTPEEALAAGIVHGLAADVVAAAVAQAQRFAAGGLDAVADTKADLIAPVLARIDATAAAQRERFLDRWFAPDARARVGALRAQLDKRVNRP
jgi:enoyl-CoA hydratase